MRFDIYKRGQGKYTRLCSAFGAAIIAGLGCYRLYVKLDSVGSVWDPRVTMWVSTMVPAGLFVVLSLVIFWVVNKASVADFLIAAEGEVKKVSWSSRKEITVSTLIVIVVVIVMSVLLGLVDYGFALFFREVVRI